MPTNKIEFPSHIYSTLESWGMGTLYFTRAMMETCVKYLRSKGFKASFKNAHRWNFARYESEKSDNYAIYENDILGEIVVMVSTGNNPEEFFVVDEAEDFE